MARSGKFGRLPRAAPAIGSVIAALAREMAAMEDRNLVSAWEKGGEVDGKKITDEDILSHFRGRRDAVDPNDPMWEYYDNLVTNYEFSIEDSKMTLKYANEEVGDMDMAAFYTQWATKFPTDSEAYRNTMRTAASYRSRGQAGAAAGSARARQEAYGQELENVYSAYQAPWNTASSVIIRALQGAGALTITEDLNDLRTAGEGGTERDFSALLAVFDTLSNSQDPYYVTLRSELEAAGLGGLTYSDFVALGQRNHQGWMIAADTATRYDDADNARKYAGYGSDFNMELAFVEDADEWTAYERRREQFVSEWTKDGLSQQDYRDIANRYADDLNKMLVGAGSAQLHGALTSEINTIRNPAAGAGQSGIEIGTGAVSDLQLTLTDLKIYDQQIDNVRNGKQFFTPYTTNSDGTRTNQWSVVDPGQTGDKTRGTVVFMQQGVRTVPVYIPYGEVRSRAGAGADPQSLETTSGLKPVPGSSDLIGVTYLDPNTGERKWGIFKDDGRLEWYDHPPFQMPGGGAYSADMATFDAAGNAVITWTPPSDSPEMARGQYVPEAVIDAGMDQGGAEIAGKFMEQEEQYYLGSHKGRIAALHTTAEQYAMTLDARGVTGGPAAQAIVAFEGWKRNAATAENEALQDRRLASETRRQYHGLMEGSIATGEVGQEYVIPVSREAAQAHRIEWRDRMRTATETFMETYGGGLSPQDQRLIRQMTPEELTSWLAQSRRAVRVQKGVVPTTIPGYDPGSPQPWPNQGFWAETGSKFPWEQPDLPALGGAGRLPYNPAPIVAGAPGAPPQIKVPTIKPPTAPLAPPPTNPVDLGEPKLPPPKPQTYTYPSTGKPIPPHLIR